MTLKTTGSLFGDDSQLTVPKEQLSNEQKRYARLCADIEAEKKHLQRFVEMAQRIEARADAEMRPMVERADRLRVQLFVAIDAALQGGVKLNKTQHRRLARWLLSSVESYLTDSMHCDELEAVFNRYSDLPWREFHAEREAEAMAITENFISDVYGVKIMEGHAAENVEDLMRFVKEKLEGARAERKPRRKSPAQQKKQERDEKYAQEASQNVREVYRKLASFLHPDREPDVERRAQRTALMQRVNIAYEANDLMSLLTLQREAEGLSASDPAGFSPDRLKIYIRVLEDQLKMLRKESDQVQQGLRASAGPGSAGFRYPVEFERAFDACLAREARIVSNLEVDLNSAKDPTQCRSLLLTILGALGTRAR